MATNNGDVLTGWVGVLELRNEARGTNDVEGGDTEEALGVVDALGLENFGGNGDGGVDLNSSICHPYIANVVEKYRVGDDQDVGFGSMISGSFGQIADDGGISVEEI